MLAALIGFVGCTVLGTEEGTLSQEEDRASMEVEAEVLSAYIQDQSQFVLVDARTVEEFEAGHIDGASNLPLGDFDEMSEHLTLKRDEVVLVYCKSGTRAKKLANKLSAADYKRVRVIPSHQLKFIDGEVIFASLE